MPASWYSSRAAPLSPLVPVTSKSRLKAVFSPIRRPWLQAILGCVRCRPDPLEERCLACAGILDCPAFWPFWSCCSLWSRIPRQLPRLRITSLRTATTRMTAPRPVHPGKLLPMPGRCCSRGIPCCCSTAPTPQRQPVWSILTSATASPANRSPSRRSTTARPSSTARGATSPCAWAKTGGHMAPSATGSSSKAWWRATAR